MNGATRRARVVVGDTLVQLADGAPDRYLMAFNCYSGELRWVTQRASSGSWTTPVLVKSEAGRRVRWELVVNGTGSTNGSEGYVISYDPSTGEELWRVRGTTDIPCPTAIVGNGLVISTSGGNGPGPIIAIRPGGSGDVTDSRVVWKSPWGGPYVPTGIIDEDRLYLISDGGILRCLELDRGDILWETRLQHSFSASLVAGDKKIYALSERGDLRVFAAGERCRLLAVNRLGERCLATPAIAHGEIFVRGEVHLFCFANATSEMSQESSPGG